MSKILKYDLKSLFKSLSPLYLIILLMSLFVKGLLLLTTKISFISFFSNISLAILIALLFALFFYTYFVIIKRYYKNLFRDEGYLTNTLPVKKSSLLVSKLVAGLIFITISLIIIAVSITFVFSGNNILGTFIDVITSFSLIFNVSKTTVVIFTIIYFLIGFLNSILLIMAGISLGQARNKNKLTLSIVFTIVLYYISQFINLICLGIYYIFNRHLFDNMITNSAPVAGKLLIFALIAVTIYNVIYYLIMNYNFSKKLNLE